MQLHSNQHLCDGRRTVLHGNGTSAMLAAVAAPQHIRQHRQAAPLHQATCSTIIGQPRYVTESACCASAFPQLVTTLCEAALLRHYTFPLPAVHDAKQLLDFLGNTHSGVVLSTPVIDAGAPLTGPPNLAMTALRTLSANA